MKDEVRLSEIWLTDSIDQVSEVSEVVPDQERSFVMGWPTVNMVVTFTSVRVKETWLDRLQQYVGFHYIMQLIREFRDVSSLISYH